MQLNDNNENSNTQSHNIKEIKSFLRKISERNQNFKRHTKKIKNLYDLLFTSNY